MKRYSAQQGFTLIELAVVLTIMAVFVGGAMTLMAKKAEQNRIEVTRERMDTIADMLEQFVRTHKRLPCPAEPQRAFSHANFAVEAGSSGNCASGSTGLENPSSTSVYMGAVPASTLNLPPSYLLDGWNRRFTYAVDANMTVANDMQTASATPDGSMNVRSLRNTNDSDNLCDQNSCSTGAQLADAVVVIVSHGQNGYGAWNGAGGSARGSTTDASTAEIENADANDVLFVQGQLTTSFDDIVLFRRGWQFPDNCDNTDCL